MRTRTTTAAVFAVLALTLTACSSSEDSSDQADVTPSAASSQTSAAPGTSAEGDRYESAQDIVDALKAAGLTVTTPKENTEQTYISEVGGKAYKFTVTDGDQAPGEAGINMFPNPEALAAWVPLSKQFGGVAVTADTWAVSLPTDGAARDDSVRLAPKVAAALDGTVQQ